MFKTFQSTRKHERAKLSEEINKEWEIKLKELTDKYEKSFTAKKKRETDKKVMGPRGAVAEERAGVCVWCEEFSACPCSRKRFI